VRKAFLGCVRKAFLGCVRKAFPRLPLCGTMGGACSKQHVLRQ
jgi:hypothetical protein